MNKALLLTIFWAGLIAFFAWDWAYSAPVDVRNAPPVIALGSGESPTGAHCASTF